MFDEITSDNLHLSEPNFAVDCKMSEPAPQEFAVNCNPAFAINCTDPEVLRLLEAATSANTRRAYDSDLRQFRGWGGTVPASPDLVARYLAHHARTLAIATLARRLVAIRKEHVVLGHADPTRAELVRQTFRGIRRTYGRPQRQAAPIMIADLVAICSLLGADLRSVRDRALILVGFFGALRRSELRALDRKDIDINPKGVTVTIRRSKSDQEARGRRIAIARGSGSICATAALEHWLARSGISEGAIFRPVTRARHVSSGRISGESISLIVKQCLRLIDREPRPFSGHSLRAGFVTTSALAGQPTWQIKLQTGHSSEAALAKYIRAAFDTDRGVICPVMSSR